MSETYEYLNRELEKPVFDDIERPEHYCFGEIECIDAIEAQLTKEEFRGFLKGQIAKYLWRERLKGGSESIKKLRWYADKLLENIE